MQRFQKTSFALLALLAVAHSVASSADKPSDVPDNDLDADLGDSEVDASESYTRLARLLPWIDNQAEELSVLRSRVVLPPPPHLSRPSAKHDHPDRKNGRPAKPIMIKEGQHPHPQVKPAKPPPPKPDDPLRQEPHKTVYSGPDQSFRNPLPKPEAIRSSMPGPAGQPEQPRLPTVPVSPDVAPQGTNRLPFLIFFHINHHRVTNISLSQNHIYLPLKRFLLSNN